MVTLKLKNLNDKWTYISRLRHCANIENLKVLTHNNNYKLLLTI